MADEGQNAAGTPNQQEQLERIQQLLAEQENSAKLLIRRDLELTRANDRLRALDQMKTDFIAIATHQMRTPLSGIRWTLSMLLKGDLGDLTTEQRTFLMKAYESNDRMISLVEDLLLSDKIESGKLLVSDEIAYVPDLIDNLLTEMLSIAAKRSIKINFSHPALAYSPVRISSTHLRAVIQNLIENAIKYSKPDGEVTIEITETNAAMRIMVADSGIGIPKDEQNKIFTRFFRAPNALKMETDGSGLGLFIVKSVVEKYQGKVWFESTEGVGTKFYIELPLAKR
ncbi:MAG TPA: HAMP domain-containing sensor histidine kinase [Candidatus Paceibacterota bacterium]|nr:HAMP domain-containing sensor histidine kinase [Candidatus Paceibacterota bacterium]